MRIKGVARLDRRTKNLVFRVCRGEIAIIDHEDIDQVACDALIHAGVRAIINLKSSITGRYYNPGPLCLCEAGIYLLDCVDPKVMRDIKDGEIVEIHGNRLLKNGLQICTGAVVRKAEVLSKLEKARASLPHQVDAFILNTIEHVEQEKNSILNNIYIPKLSTEITDRHVLVVSRGRGYHEDLKAVIPYILRAKPIIIAVDGAADILLRLGIFPHILVGDMDSASDYALKTVPELVVHVYPDGQSPGRERLRKLNLKATECQVPGISEDLALLLAYEKGAELIVIVGSHSSIEDFLDKGRKGMASTFLTRLKVGSVLIDAKGVSKLYKSTLHRNDIAKVVLAGLIPLSTGIATSQAFRQLLKLIIMHFKLAIWSI
ncbi:MAG: hypothetical protein GX969_05045 [Firmicutes bacterium]|nr:hypothetical protein [Bacillota bacterium]